MSVVGAIGFVIIVVPGIGVFARMVNNADTAGIFNTSEYVIIVAGTAQVTVGPVSE